ncbi:hypothetical protein [Nostoc sp. UHCC 0252]|uniref:hypothetical protein n=1 Tax=Nostoc sp. UHCC 0252 TaxID=3110241 RepID=UPI002B1E91E6|nr:hypothetical protein [Nostoc sp. UHCC 0252]MEA5606104.1 hypothetical protein [Nostoc sp. UHCC 0252]
MTNNIKYDEFSMVLLVAEVASSNWQDDYAIGLTHTLRILGVLGVLGGSIN